MALETKVLNYERLRYFNGLFLYAPDFQAESDFHLATRRRLNYLLLRPGVLYHGEGEPLAVTADGTTTVTVATGDALVPGADGQKQAHEVHVDVAQTLNLASADVGASDNDKVYVTIGFAEEAEFSVPTGDGVSPPTEEDRTRHCAIVGASVTAPAVGDAAIVLAEVTYHPAGIDDETDVTDRRVRGGLRYEVLSQDLIEIEVAPAGVTRELGATWVYQATGVFDDGSLRRLAAGDVAWSSSDATIVAVDASTGEATALSSGGPVTITAESQGVTGTAEATVATSLVTIAVSPGSATLEIGDSRAFTATGTFDDGSTRALTAAGDGLLWTSADPSIVSIDAATGVAIGQASGGPVTITAEAAGISGEAAVTVAVPHLVSLLVTPNAAELEIGGRQSFTATGTFNDGSARPLTTAEYDLVWISDNPDIVSIDPATGMAIGRAPGGPVPIIAEAGGVHGEALVTVAALRLIGISVAPTAVALEVGGQQTFVATGTFNDGSTRRLEAADRVEWISTEPGIVSIDARTGVATGRDPGGPVTILAEAAGVTGTAQASVVRRPSLVGITIEAERRAIPRGEPVELRATGHFDIGPDENLTREVSWESSDTRVARFVEAGVAVAEREGLTTITASLDRVRSNELVLVVGVPEVDRWPNDEARQAHGGETLRIFGERFVDDLDVSFRPPSGDNRVVVRGRAASLTEASVVVPGPRIPTTSNPAVIHRNGTIRVITTAGESNNSPQAFRLLID